MSKNDVVVVKNEDGSIWVYHSNSLPTKNAPCNGVQLSKNEDGVLMVSGYIHNKQIHGEITPRVTTDLGLAYTADEMSKISDPDLANGIKQAELMESLLSKVANTETRSDSNAHLLRAELRETSRQVGRDGR